MLVLSRYRDESIYIGDDVVITVIDVRGDRVRIGIQAPPDVSVHRQEVYDAIKGEQRSSSAGHRAEPAQSVPPKGSSPLGQKLDRSKAKALPVNIDTPPLGFGGLTDVTLQ